MRRLKPDGRMSAGYEGRSRPACLASQLQKKLGRGATTGMTAARKYVNGRRPDLALPAFMLLLACARGGDESLVPPGGEPAFVEDTAGGDAAPPATEHVDAGYGNRDDDPPGPDAGPWSDGTEWLLLLGFDDWERFPGRTDAIILAAFRHATGDIGLVSIPRDLRVDVPGAEPGRINKVYRVGEMLHGEGGGRRLMVEVLRNELGIGVHHTVTADFHGFELVIDLLGGIQVDVACPIRDNFTDEASPAGYVQLDLEAGRRRLDGRTALLYSRSRHGRSDIDRTRRQQAVLAGLKRRLTVWNVVPRLPWLWRATRAHTHTDLDLSDAVRLARTVVSAGPGMVHGLVLKPPMIRSGRSPKGQYILLLDRDLFAEALEGLFDAPAPGIRERVPCPDKDAAIDWRKRFRENQPREGAGLPDGDDCDLDDDDAPNPAK